MVYITEDKIGVSSSLLLAAFVVRRPAELVYAEVIRRSRGQLRLETSILFFPCRFRTILTDKGAQGLLFLWILKDNCRLEHRPNMVNGLGFWVFIMLILTFHVTLILRTMISFYLVINLSCNVHIMGLRLKRK